MSNNMNEKQAAGTIKLDMDKLSAAATEWANMPDDDTEGDAWWALVRFVTEHGDARAEEARREATAEIARKQQVIDLVQRQYGELETALAELHAQRTASGDAVAFVYTGQTGHELESELEGYTHGTRFYAHPVEEAAAQADGKCERCDDGMIYVEEAFQPCPQCQDLTGYDDDAAAPTAQPTPPDDERAAFETWYTSSYRDKSEALTRCTDGEYAYGEVQGAWEAWEEVSRRAALRHPPVPNVGEVAAQPSPGCQCGQTHEWCKANECPALPTATAAQPPQAGAEPAAATIDTPEFRNLMAHMQYSPTGESPVKRLADVVAHIDAAIAAAREEGRKAGHNEAMLRTMPAEAGRQREEYGRTIADLRARLASAGAGEAVAPFQPTEQQFTDWCERHSIHHTYRDAFEDAASLYLAARQDSAAADKGEA